MRYFPAFFDIDGRSCLVVGGGALAVRKVRLLLRAHGRVTVVAQHLGAELTALWEDGAITVIRRGFVAGDLRGKALAIAATGNAAVDARVAEAAQAAAVPVNVVDRPELSTFTVPAIVDRDPVVIGISTGAAAPVLARRIRARIEEVLPARLGRLARFAGGFRGALAANRPEGAARRYFWERFFDGPIAADVLAGRESAGREAMIGLINRPEPEARAGSVAIVGAGPGDPDLLTLRALDALQRAEVIVYDKLVGPDILGYARRDAERIYVGKARGNHAKTQDEINALLLDHARWGRQVVRLKGGDPFVFGRGGEERDYLRRHGIAVSVVPGITAATACGAAAGIPLTHRDHAAAVTFVTGHGKHGEPELDWAALARPGQTLVVYMGIATAARTAERLIAHGLAADTPIAIVEKGSLPDQRTVPGALADLADLVHRHAVEGPAVIVIGAVARFADAAAEVVAAEDPLSAIAV